MIRPGSSFDIPCLNYFTSKNRFTGSLRGMGYLITPGDGLLQVAVWHGGLRSDLSRMDDEAAFPLDQGGLDQTLAWLEERASDFSQAAPD